jgi:hypothetical protein
MRHARDTSNTVIAQSPLPEIVDSTDGRAVDDMTDKRPRPLVFDVFAEDENGLVKNGQPPAKRPRRASSASSSVRPEDLNRKEEMLDCHEWQAQRIVGERQTPSGLEYEVRVEKTGLKTRMPSKPWAVLSAAKNLIFFVYIDFPFRHNNTNHLHTATPPYLLPRTKRFLRRYVVKHEF